MKFDDLKIKIISPFSNLFIFSYYTESRREILNFKLNSRRELQRILPSANFRQDSQN